MANRLQLHELLKTLCGNVYYQPPAKECRKYPCIEYTLNDIVPSAANNRPYLRFYEYTLMVIDPNPDSTIRDAVSELPMCTMDRYYPADGLNHFVFTIYY